MRRPGPIGLGVGAIVAAAMAVSLYLALVGQTQVSSGASTYSHSALGHSVLMEVLRRRGVDARASRGASREKLHGEGLLVLAEPDFDSSAEALKALLRARRVLLVLPKWQQSGAADAKGWIGLAVPRPLPLVQVPLDDAQLPADHVIRPEGALAPATPLAGGGAPHLEPPVQLIAPGRLAGVIAGRQGVLLGMLGRRRGTLWVLSDPDVISNHGMASGNAALAVAIIDQARQGGPVLFDETIHGFSSVPSGQFHLLAARPFVAATLDALLAVGLVVWATGRRFGVAARRPDAIAAGRLSLIASIAGLMVYAGHLGDMLRRYVAVSIEDVAARLHAPDTGETAARAAWLAQAEAQRGLDDGEAALRQAAEGLAGPRTRPDAAFALARRTYRWKQEMLRGA